MPKNIELLKLAQERATGFLATDKNATENQRIFLNRFWKIINPQEYLFLKLLGLGNLDKKAKDTAKSARSQFKHLQEKHPEELARWTKAQALVSLQAFLQVLDRVTEQLVADKELSQELVLAPKHPIQDKMKSLRKQAVLQEAFSAILIVIQKEFTVTEKHSRLSSAQLASKTRLFAAAVAYGQAQINVVGRKQDVADKDLKHVRNQFMAQAIEQLAIVNPQLANHIFYLHWTVPEKTFAPETTPDDRKIELLNFPPVTYSESSSVAAR